MRMIEFKELKVAYWKPRRITPVIDWIQHAPFAFTLIQWHRPNIFVELGTRTGVSYCAFCQAIESLRLSSKCFAVDTWKGDEHAGYYPEDIFIEFSDYHDRNYKDFSVLMRMTFDEALGYFSDESVDLLHIDGLHFYDTVKHDFESWLPKMSPRGIVLLHDTNVRRDDFGVWRLFKEVKAHYPCFEFLHGCGLGIIAVGSDALDLPISKFLQASEQESVCIRSFFASLGMSIEAEHQIHELTDQIAEKDARIAEKDARIAEKDARIAEKDARIAEKDARIAEKDARIAEKDARIAEKDARIAEKDADLERLLASRSWRLTAPVRAILRQIRELRGG